MSNFSSTIKKSKNNLILYPPILKSSNVIAHIIINKFFVGKNLLIISDKGEEINKCLPQNLPDSFYNKYKYNMTIKQSLNEKNKYLIIDNIKKFREMNIERQVCNLVIIGTLGIMSEDVKYINKMNFKCSVLELADIGPKLNYSLCMYEDKIKMILSIIVLLSGRHVLYVKDIDSFINKCESYLTEIKKHHIIIDDEDTPESIKEGIESMRDNTLVITSIIPEQDFMNISHLHFYDEFEYETYKKFTDRIYLKNMYTKPIGKLTIYYHINNSEVDKYKIIKNKLSEEQYQYSHLLKRSIVLTP